MIRKLSTLLFLGVITLSSYGQTTHRYLLLEHFTNTRCSLCPGRNGVLHQTLEDNPGVVHHISYHPSVPYNSCVLYRHNEVDNNARKDQYGVSFTPQAFLWGTSSRVGSTLLPKTTLTDNLGQTAPLQVQVKESSTSNGRSVDIDIRTFDTPPTGDVRLFTAVVERHVNYNAPNGETNHYNVFRQMLPSKDGEIFTPAPVGESVSFTYQYPFDADWDTSEIYILAFVQEMNSNDVINSGTQNDLNISLSAVAAGSGTGSATVSIEGGIPPYSVQWDDNDGQTTKTANNLAAGLYQVTIMDSVGITLRDTIRVEGSVSIENELESKISVFPNPANDQFNIKMDGIDARNTVVNMYNSQGQRIQNINSQINSRDLLTISVTNLPKGVYYFDILVSSGRVTRMVMID